ncbi:MAG: YdeI/OmpD-associated family protein, partial [Candidatus Phosphoribacter sp.]
EVEVPADLAAALAADPTAAAAYERLAFSHRKEYAVWVSAAVQDRTRQRRVEKTLEMLREGRTRG